MLDHPTSASWVVDFPLQHGLACGERISCGVALIYLSSAALINNIHARSSIQRALNCCVRLSSELSNG